MAKYTIEECDNRIQWYTDLKSIMQEGERIINQGAQPQMDEEQQNRIAKVVYITMQSAPKAASWLLLNVPGYAAGITRAQKRLEDSLYEDCAGDPLIDKMAGDIRRVNVKHARSYWGS